MNDLVVTARPTDEEVIVAGFPCRVWQGTTAAGLPCVLFVARVETAARGEIRAGGPVACQVSGPSGGAARA